MEIRPIATLDELSMAIAFFIDTFPMHRNLFTDPDSTYAYAAWERCFLEDPSLLVTAFENGQIIGTAWAHGGTVGPVAVDLNYRGRGIASLLIHELEERCLRLGIETLWLGAAEEAEGFYLKCGYQPSLLIQAKRPVTLNDLRTENAIYAEEWTYEDETDVRLCLRTPEIDKQLQRRYDEVFPDCSTQVTFSKRLKL